VYSFFYSKLLVFFYSRLATQIPAGVSFCVRPRDG
jgi:hypothetical protein